MAFNKFEPHKPEVEGHGASSDSAHRRSLILKYAWWITMANTAMGFGFIAYWIVKG